jgi:enoyl-CoA hydratase/carnithine racemase
MVPDEAQLDEAIGETIETLLKNSGHAMSACKTLLRALGGRPIDPAAMEETAQRATTAQSSADGHYGMLALVEKRKPEWAAGR